jgi:hypothetical protein
MAQRGKVHHDKRLHRQESEELTTECFVVSYGLDEVSSGFDRCSVLIWCRNELSRGYCKGTPFKLGERPATTLADGQRPRRPRAASLLLGASPT